MGTNYYIVCNCCNTALKHIGKQSAGWDFLSNISKNDLIDYIKNMDKQWHIQDEYGKDYTLEQFLKKVTDKWRLHESCRQWFNAGESGWC